MYYFDLYISRNSNCIGEANKVCEVDNKILHIVILGLFKFNRFHLINEIYNKYVDKFDFLNHKAIIIGYINKKLITNSKYYYFKLINIKAYGFDLEIFNSLLSLALEMKQFHFLRSLWNVNKNHQKNSLIFLGKPLRSLQSSSQAFLY